MTELKSEHQPTPTIQPQSGSKRTRSARSVKAETIPVEVVMPAEQLEEPTKRKRKTTSTPKTTRAKSQATTKTSQTATTQVKLAWEMPPSTVGARFTQLEQELYQLKGQATEVNDQIGGILSEMEELRLIAKSVERDRTGEYDEAQSGVQLPKLEAQSKTIPTAQPLKTTLQSTVDTASLRQALQEPPVAEIKPQHPQPERTPPTLPTQTRIRSTPIPPLSPQPTRTAKPLRRRRNLRYSLHQIKHHSLQLPKKPVFIAADSALWVLASAGLQFSLKFLVSSIPVLSGAVAGLIVIPVLATIYLAFFKPNVNAIALYRLLLITLGLFVGGKL